MKKVNIKKHLFIGFLIGLVATTIGFYFYTQIYQNYSLKFIQLLIKDEGMLPSLLTYAAMPNLLAFFVFIKRNEDYKAKGVIIATFFIAIAMLISKFIF